MKRDLSGVYETIVKEPTRLALWKNIKVMNAAVDFQEAIAAIHRRAHPFLFEECPDSICSDTRAVVRSILDDLNERKR